MKPRFDFVHDTMILLPDDSYFRVLVVVYGADEFELWNPDTGIPFNFSLLPLSDRNDILCKISEHFVPAALADAEIAAKKEDRAWDVREINRARGIA